jgi:DNA-binding transcriptional regulator YhcF (GntR family)
VNPSFDLAAGKRQPAYRRILDGLRAQIMTGKLAPGTQLPSTRELAATWKSNPFTIHTALAALAKEGWLDRHHGSGTFIADPRNRFHCAGIYHSVDIGLNEQPAFLRSLHFSLLKKFELLKKDTQVFMDSRPDAEQGKLLPALQDAIKNRRIQCLVAPVLNEVNTPALISLRLPTAFGSKVPSPRRAEYDDAAMIQGSVRRLKAKGCRSIGFIDNAVYSPRKGVAPPPLVRNFLQAIREEGLLTRDEWIRSPSSPPKDLEQYGHEQFKQLWKFRRKPDGLFVFPDTVVRGVIVALLDIGRQEVTGRMKFVFHRNAHIPVLCPLEVTWVVADEDVLADGLIKIIQMQIRREKVSPLTIQLRFEETGGTA